MAEFMPTHATPDEWIARDAIRFDVGSTASLNAAVDRLVSAFGSSVELLGFGEPYHAMHGDEDWLILRNRIFQRLVEAHGYSAIAIESSFPRGRVVNDYIDNRRSSFDAIKETGFSHGFGKYSSTRELVEWMRHYNADASHRVKLQFYGFDSPTEMTGTDSPRPLIQAVFEYLETSGERRARIEALLGKDAAWENPAAMMDPSKSIGLSSEATALRIEMEELITELHVRRPELVAKSDRERFLEAAQYALLARQMLNYHAGLARASEDRIERLLGLRDLMMAQNLSHILDRERGRGKVFAFAHNSHLKRGIAQWQLGPHALKWWPAGAQLNEMLGSRYAVIGAGVGISSVNGIAQPEPGTLEARLMSSPGPARFVMTAAMRKILEVPARSGASANPSYFPLTGQSPVDFDCIAMIDAIV